MKLILVICFSLFFIYYMAAQFIHIVKEISITDARHILNQKLCALHEKACPPPTANIFFCAQEWQQLGMVLSRYFYTTLHLHGFCDNHDGTISVAFDASGLLPKYQSARDVVMQCITYDTHNFFLSKVGYEVPMHIQTLTDTYLHLRFAYNVKGKQSLDAIGLVCKQLATQRQLPTHPKVLFRPYRNTFSVIRLVWLYDEWYTHHTLVPVNINLKKHCHILITGHTGSGKSYFTLFLLCQLLYNPKEWAIWFADFKGSRDFRFLSKHDVHYASGNATDVVALIEQYYSLFLSAKNMLVLPAKNQVLIIDEYPGLLTSLSFTDKKTCERIKQIVCELLMLGRDVNGISFNVIITAQRPDVNLLFPHGSRDNFHIYIAFGNLSSEAKGMITSSPSSLPDRNYQRGEGIASIDGKGIYEIVIPEIVGLDIAVQNAPTRRLR